MRILGTNTE